MRSSRWETGRTLLYRHFRFFYLITSLFQSSRPVKIPPYALPTKKREIIIAIKIIFAVVFFIYYFIKILIILGLIQPVLFLYSIKGAVQSKNENSYFSAAAQRNRMQPTQTAVELTSVWARNTKKELQ